MIYNNDFLYLNFINIDFDYILIFLIENIIIKFYLRIKVIYFYLILL